MNIFESRLWQYGLFPLSLIYGGGIWLRNRLYDKKIIHSIAITDCQIISVGNISLGGTGKTPVIRFLAQYLIEAGFRVAILSRGYKRSRGGTIIVSDGRQLFSNADESGDEPFLLARQLPKVPVVVEANRAQGAKVIQQCFQPHFILLDDGFQHRRLHRDFDIVLIDASVGFASGMMLPAGPLREPVSSLSRADLIWLTRIDQAKDVDHLIQRIKRYTSCRIITSKHHATQIVDAGTAQTHEPTIIRNQRVLLVSGIARPASFEQTVRNLGGIVIDHQKFGDHHRFTHAELEAILQQARRHHIDMILTTEKDFVRIMPYTREIQRIFYLVIEIQITDDVTALHEALAPLLNRARSISAEFTR